MPFLYFCDRLISLSIMFSKFIHAVANDRTSFFFKAEYSIVYHTTFSLSTCQWTRRLFLSLGYCEYWQWTRGCRHLFDPDSRPFGSAPRTVRLRCRPSRETWGVELSRAGVASETRATLRCFPVSLVKPSFSWWPTGVVESSRKAKQYF